MAETMSDDDKAKAAAADKEAADKAAGRRGRPSNADLDAREAELNAQRERDNAIYQEGLAAIAARQKSGTPIGSNDDTPQPALWVQYTGNLRDGGEGPEFETMKGYTFEKNGDAVLVFGSPEDRAKFRGNGCFRVVEEVEDARGMTDGDLKAADKPDIATRKRAGKAQS